MIPSVAEVMVVVVVFHAERNAEMSCKHRKWKQEQQKQQEKQQQQKDKLVETLFIYKGREAE